MRAPFGKAIWDGLGERISPRIVFEHPGESTLPTSVFVCATGGMVVICAGTTGYTATMDLRYQWMRQKRFQGSHLSNDPPAAAVAKLVSEGKVDPCPQPRFSRVRRHPRMPPADPREQAPLRQHGGLVNARQPGQGATR